MCLERGHGGAEVARLALRILELARDAVALAERPVVERECGESPLRQSLRVVAGGLLLDRRERPGRHDRCNGVPVRREIQHPHEPVRAVHEREGFATGIHSLIVSGFESWLNADVQLTLHQSARVMPILSMRREVVIGPGLGRHLFCRALGWTVSVGVVTEVFGCGGPEPLDHRAPRGASQVRLA